MSSEIVSTKIGDTRTFVHGKSCKYIENHSKNALGSSYGCFLYKKTCNCMILYSFLSKKFSILLTYLF